jgi:metal-dependent amidase/aminoacylase/carboxypeptidase family protein
LRSFKDEDLDFLKKRVSGKVSEKARKYGLESEIGFTEEFPATQGSDKEVELVKDTARELDLSIEEPENSFRWSEDFGHYTRHSKGAFFGLGSGKDIPDLHNPDYDFPDEIIPSGINMFISILDKLETK